MNHGGDRLIVVVDDEDEIRFVLRAYLEKCGFRVVEAANGHDALAAAQGKEPDLMLVDLLLGDMHGFDVIRSIRKDSDVPIIALTGKSDSHDVVGGLEAGADDYVTKPFRLPEVRARILAALRRIDLNAEAAPPDVVSSGSVTVLPQSGEAVVAGNPVSLTKLEFQVLLELMLAEGRVLSREELLEQVWGYSADNGDPRIVDNIIRRLRTKIESDPATPVHLVTVRGFGFRWLP